MRRKEKVITEASLIEEILATNYICRIAFANNNEPYIVPMNYGYRGGFIYLHSAGEGKKIECMKNNDAVCFEITDSIDIVGAETACNFGTTYRSVIGRGRMSIVRDAEEKRFGLQALVDQIKPKSEKKVPFDAVEKVLVMRIEIDQISGKKSGL